jgi:predicted metal-dependent hydrolase
MNRLTFKTPTGALEYTIIRRSRLKKRLHMELDNQGGLVVVAPEHWSGRHISATLAQNTARVERFLKRARERHIQAPHYVNGELHFYLGTRYPLVVHWSSGLKPSVIFTGHELRIEIRQITEGNIQAVLQAWYRQQALSVFRDRLQFISQKAAWTRDRVVPLKLRRMKRTWGNCSASGVIKLNTHLIKAPTPLIDSVVAHELCHLQEMNHGKAFYALLESLNPDWRKDRTRLRSEGNVYLN